MRIGKVAQRLGPGPSKLTVEINNCNFEQNKIEIWDSSISSFTTFSAPVVRGGAVSIEAECPTNLSVISSSFDSNTINVSYVKAQATFGGALDVDIPHRQSTASIIDSVFEKNSAHAGTGSSEDLSIGFCAGGAVSAFANHVMTVQNCSFLHNRCHGGSGGMYVVLFDFSFLQRCALTRMSRRGVLDSLESHKVEPSLTSRLEMIEIHLKQLGYKY